MSSTEADSTQLARTPGEIKAMLEHYRVNRIVVKNTRDPEVSDETILEPAGFEFRGGTKFSAGLTTVSIYSSLTDKTREFWDVRALPNPDGEGFILRGKEFYQNVDVHLFTD